MSGITNPPLAFVVRVCDLDQLPLGSFASVQTSTGFFVGTVPHVFEVAFVTLMPAECAVKVVGRAAAGRALLVGVGDGRAAGRSLRVGSAVGELVVVASGRGEADGVGDSVAAGAVADGVGDAVPASAGSSGVASSATAVVIPLTVARHRAIANVASWRTMYFPLHQMAAAHPTPEPRNIGL